MNKEIEVREFTERSGINALIQGSAADIIKVARERIYERLQKDNKKSKMILQVQDELNFNVVPDELEYMKKMVFEEVENAAKLTVPLKTKIGIGDKSIN